jgi:hypothetical protein
MHRCRHQHQRLLGVHVQCDKVCPEAGIPLKNQAMGLLRKECILPCISATWQPSSPRNWQLSVWTVLAPVSSTWLTLFPFALTRPFCCTARGRLLVSRAHSHVITCDQPYSLEEMQTGSFEQPWFTGFAVLRAVVIFCDITPYSPFKVNLRFGGSYRLRLQGRMRPARYLHESTRLATSFHAVILLGLFDPEDGDYTLLRNVGWLSKDYTALYNSGKTYRRLFSMQI